MVKIDVILPGQLGCEPEPHDVIDHSPRHSVVAYAITVMPAGSAGLSIVARVMPISMCPSVQRVGPKNWVGMGRRRDKYSKEPDRIRKKDTGEQ